ncbi:M20 aminoacylase family protein [Variovorax sp. J22R133]|uniref:M20 aminoacylase family protein n=1 Tax=Variovorax brevis TaxID=3053503 RepID=UPI0025750A1E|nr:M20 aminoacylase family protein [Variovorax sp. J22R133]MDM0117389.1 M20 aminoacylase family protein [Variovorax sp. J22R133]
MTSTTLSPTASISAQTCNRMVAWRRDFHAHPETAFEEHRTAQVLVRALETMGLEVHRGLAGTGVVATLRNGEGPTIGLRADMDALHICERGTAPHASTVPGKMHGCGHDGHMAMLLGAAQHLSEHRSFEGTVHFIFQPAEENEGGGRAMVEQGLFKLFPCDAVYGLHNAPGLAFGHFATRPGPMLACSDLFEIVITGKGAHAAHPQDSVDPVLASAQLIAALQGIVSRNVSAADALVVSVTQIQGGDTWNVIPESVTLRGTCRAFLPAVQDRAEARIRAICAGVAESSETGICLNYRRHYPAVVNTPEHVDVVARAASKLVGAEQVDAQCALRMGSEDFAFMLQACPGAYAIIGTARTRNDPPVHNPLYDFNDDILSLGAAYWVTLAHEALRGPELAG